MRKLIATIRLERGQTGYYDKLTNIHLTLTDPIGYVYEGMNVSVLKRSVKANRIKVISGSLEPLKEIDKKVIPTAEQVVAQQQVAVEQETSAIKEAIQEEVIEQPIEEVVEEQPKKKRKNKKVEESTEKEGE